MKVKKIAFNFFSVFALFFNYQLFYEQGFFALFKDKFLLVRICLSIVLIMALYSLNKREDIKENKYYVFLSSLFSLFLFIGNSYRTFGTITIPFYPRLFLLSIIKYIGYYNVIRIILNKIDSLLKVKPKKLKKIKYLSWFDKHPFLTPFLTLICAWSIYYIAFYPIVLSPDPSYQIKQALGERTKYSDYTLQINPNVNITNHHPVVHTVMLGTFIKIGRTIINDNFGLFLYSLTQGLFMAFTLAYTVYYLKKKKLNNRYLLFMICVYALVPMFPFYAINANKDVYYTLFIIWFLMLIFDLIYDKEKICIKKAILWFVILLLICLFRNNGIYLVLFTLPFLLVYKKENTLKLITIFSCVLCLFGIYKVILLPKWGITDTSPRESMSIFFQQTSRYVINHEKDLSEKDKNIISNIISYQKIKSDYDPRISDPIKNTFNKYATSKDIKAYLKVWAKGLIKHPITYIDATLNNTYGYFDVGDTSWYIYANYDSRVTQNNLVDYHYNKLSFLRTPLAVYGATFLYYPVIGLISNIGFNAWIIIAYAIWMIKKRLYKYIPLLVPLGVSMLVCIASPVNTYFRYAMPFVFSTIFVIGTWILIKNKKN